MFNKNVFTQKDPIADLIKPMLEAQTQAKMEELKGNQAVLDKNKNNKLDAQDFKILRGEKKTVKEEEQVEEGWDDMMKAVKARSGPQPSGGSGVKAGRAYGGAAQKSKPEHDDADDKKKTQKEEVEQIDEKEGYGGSDPLANRADYAKRHGTGQVYKKTHPGNKTGMTQAYAYNIKRSGPKGKLPEEVEQVDERSLTADEKAKMEKNVKGMKKSFAGFKARYGDRAKSVMYATATKAAKKD